MTKFTLRRFECVPTLVTAAAFLLMMSLGVWQLQRLAWKEALIAQSENAQALEALTALPEHPDAAELAFRRVKLSGTFLHDKEFHLAPRYHGEKFGYHLLTPLRLKDKRFVLVNRGWIPADKKDPDTRPETLTKGKAAVEGVLRVPLRQHWFMMDNKPGDNMWFWHDLAAMEAAVGTPLLPIIVEATGEVQPGVLPVPSGGAFEWRNDHLGYALTWFAVAIGVLVIFVVYHRGR